MREIKFRAWDKKEKKMYTNASLIMSNETWSLRRDDDSESFDVEPMQFTGIKDKNGKEIYEGDILKNTKHKNQLVEVYWEGCFTEEGCVNGDHWISWGGWNFRKRKDDKDYTFAIYDNEIEVIGNIYENPDLLKEELP